MRFCDLRKSHFDTMLQTLLDEDYAISQIRNAVNLAARILDDALAEDLIPKTMQHSCAKMYPRIPNRSASH